MSMPDFREREKEREKKNTRTRRTSNLLPHTLSLIHPYLHAELFFLFFKTGADQKPGAKVIAIGRCGAHNKMGWGEAE